MSARFKGRAPRGSVYAIPMFRSVWLMRLVAHQSPARPLLAHRPEPILIQTGNNVEAGLTKPLALKLTQPSIPVAQQVFRGQNTALAGFGTQP